MEVTKWSIKFTGAFAWNDVPHRDLPSLNCFKKRSETTPQDKCVLIPGVSWGPMLFRSDSVVSFGPYAVPFFGGLWVSGSSGCIHLPQQNFVNFAAIPFASCRTPKEARRKMWYVWKGSPFLLKFLHFFIKFLKGFSTFDVLLFHLCLYKYNKLQN